eukprot:5855339-Pleurochrysis_carterae.AAC.1
MGREYLYHDNAVSLWSMPVTVHWKLEVTEVRLRWQIVYYGSIIIGKACSSTASKCANTVKCVAIEIHLP